MIRVTLVDMSRTLVKGSGVNSAADYLGKGDTYRQLYPLYKAGKITMKKLLIDSLACWRGFSEEDLEKVYKKFEFNEDAKETIREIKKSGIKTVLLTNIPTNLGRLFQEDLGFDFISGTVCEVKDGKFTGNILEFHNNKAEEAMKFLKKLRIDPKEALSIGDRRDDAEVFELVGVGVAYNGDETARKKAKYCISNFGDLLKIIKQENS